jgi:4-hydroxy-tetrahydrodipicolinate reductase
MRLALFGHGQMGRVVEAYARDAGHEIGSILTSANATDAARLLPGHDAAIDFSVAHAVTAHVEACLTARVPLVQGTTGWQGEEHRVRQLVGENGGALVYGPNFSIGVNLFYRVAAGAAALFRGLPAYDAFIEEAHHAKKRDAPSGTALALQAILCRELGRRDVPVSSTRAGDIPGTHRIGFDSTADQILLVHTARSRAGFAAGALLAARWIAGRPGVFAFTDVLDDLLAMERKLS